MYYLPHICLKGDFAFKLLLGPILNTKWMIIAVLYFSKLLLFPTLYMHFGLKTFTDTETAPSFWFVPWFCQIISITINKTTLMRLTMY